MSDFAKRDGEGLVFCKNHERMWIVPWGPDGVRVRVTHESRFVELPNALLEPAPASDPVEIEIGEKEASLRNGEITVRLSQRGNVTFEKTSTGEVRLKERTKTTSEYLGRTFKSLDGVWHVEQRFFADEKERLYGLGQHQHGFLDQKGCVVDLRHLNMEVAIPFLVSSLGYGFLWNHPGTGRVELGRNETRWVSYGMRQEDYYVVIADTPAEIMKRYADVTGHPSRFPEWASGFWQCKLRYKTQDEVLSVAREYKERGLPISVIVIDFFHWTRMGEWKFDPENWPDPAAMASELKEMGIEVMVSVWPTVNATSENYNHMAAQGMLVRTEHGMPVQTWTRDNDGGLYNTFYDAMNPDARAFLWEKIREGYVTNGIKLFWLDTCEPELIPPGPENVRYHLGNGREVSGLYPVMHAQCFYDGLRAEGEEAVLTLCRSAWCGSQRVGAAVWSADIPSTFDSLRRQVPAGLNIALSGIPWWTTDIGGFHGGNIEDPKFRELLVRWFQYGVFCPIFRVHGVRRWSRKGESAPNEVWSYGDEVYEILREQLLMRERMRPYVMEQMRLAERDGTPPMRPVFFDFPHDPRTWEVEDQFMFGPDIMVAPVVAEGVRARKVYLAEGTRWKDVWTDKVHEGGTDVECDAPLSRIPVFVREGAEVPLRG